jgi:periplasmic glucans biosynthesis protein
VDRRSFLLQLAALALAQYPARQAQAAVDSSQIHTADIRRLVRRRAQALSEVAYVPPDTSVPQRLASMGYDEYGEISFRSERGIWRGEPSDFELQLFHRGFIFPHRMRVFVVEDGVTRPLAYDPSLFGFGLLGDIGQARFGDIGYAGIRVLYPINNPSVPEEFLVFRSRASPANGRSARRGISLFRRDLHRAPEAGCAEDRHSRGAR